MRIVIIMIIGTLLISPLNAGMIGDYFQSDKHKCSINANGWQPLLNTKKKLIILKAEDGISEVDLEVAEMEVYEAESALEVAKARIEGYDGWVYIGGRQLEPWEIRNANAEDGFIVMYSKNIFNKVSKKTKILVAEKYYVKGEKAYIISMLTTERSWPKTKSKLVNIAKSFKLH
jgi:hypothetical protein